MAQNIKQNAIQCLSPNCCDNTSYMVIQDEVKAYEPVEFVSKDATTGKITAKKLTDPTKIIGVALEDVQAGKIVEVIDRGDLRVEPIIIPAGMARKDLVADTTNAPHLNLRRGDTV